MEIQKGSTGMKPHIVPAGKGRSFDVLGGDHIVFKATGAETGGAFATLETTVPAGGGPPPHLHRNEDEAFYVISGDFEFTIDGETHTAGPGDFLFAPRGAPHVFRNTGDQAGVLLITVQPAGFEHFVEAFAQIPTNAPPDPVAMANLGAQFGIEFV